MPPPPQFMSLLRLLSTLFADEPREGAHQAVAAVDEILSHSFDVAPCNSPANADICREALGIRPHPDAPTIVAALPFVNWHNFGLEDGRIRPEIAREMLTAEILGPTGMVFHPNVRIGLFMQSANVDYVTRIHAAEETFVMLSGTGYWAQNGEEPVQRRAGDIIHHPSNMSHSTVTKNEPLIAAWRWGGDISIDEYFLKG